MHFFVDFFGTCVILCSTHDDIFSSYFKILVYQNRDFKFFFRSDSNENYHSIIPIFVRVAFMVWGLAYTVGLKLKKGQKIMWTVFWIFLIEWFSECRKEEILSKNIYLVYWRHLKLTLFINCTLFPF